MLAGDFNKPLLDDDKFGGKAISVSRSLLFKDCLDKCSMIDIGFSSGRFTWTNKTKSPSSYPGENRQVFC
mgnify:CR=1 FL=1